MNMTDYNKNRAAAAAPRPRPETPNLPAAAVAVAVAVVAEVERLDAREVGELVAKAKGSVVEPVAETEAAVRAEVTEERMGAPADEHTAMTNCRASVLGLRQRYDVLWCVG